MDIQQQLIDKIKSQFEHDKNFSHFPDFITDIHFPCFKGLEKDSAINFQFPITVLIGKNGCGKTSILQALETAPEGKSYTQKWFSTSVDPIPEEPRPAFWYSFNSVEAKKNVEILNIRIKKEKNPDYWEPSRPIVKYGMKKFQETQTPPFGALKTRWKGTKREVIYLDFRGELSAFDKYFYFGDRPNTKTMQTKQDYIRKYSRHLKKAMDGHLQIGFTLRKKIKIKELQTLTEDEIKVVSNILGKQYDKIKIITHSFYGQLGESVQFKQANLQSETFQGVYTEAFAGSGESAIVKLVHQIYNANKGALILLDEPEVSLHPSAQRQLIYFLLQKTLEKGLQVIFATHSPLMIESLPKEAIVLLVQTPEGVFSPRCSVLPEFVFQDIGYNVEKPKILVEDKAAKELLESCLELHNSEAKKSMDIEFHAGGAEDIIKEIVMLSRLKNSKIYFVLDGDKHYRNIPAEQTVASSQLDSLLKEITGIDAKKLGFIADSGNELQLENEKRNFLKYFSTHTYFLPKATPEEIMWEASQVEKPTYTTPDYKQRICEWVKHDIGDDVHSSDIDTYRKKLCHKLDKEHDDIKKLINMLLVILDKQRNN